MNFVRLEGNNKEWLDNSKNLQGSANKFNRNVLFSLQCVTFNTCKNICCNLFSMGPDWLPVPMVMACCCIPLHSFTSKKTLKFITPNNENDQRPNDARLQPVESPHSTSLLHKMDQYDYIYMFWHRKSLSIYFFLYHLCHYSCIEAAAT